ncbi:hypothetical protein EAF04_009553 [Stromatinia cepivora]|nr:hypothetical protein EAF04_009553 [Stromatinia cepivora]
MVCLTSCICSQRLFWEVASDEAQGLGFSNILFSVATFLALTTQTSTLQLAEIHIILLLVVGYHYFIPSIVMKLIRSIKQKPIEEQPKSKELRGWVYSLLVGLFFCAISCFQPWFWDGHFQHRDQKSNTCPDFGFGFVRVDLENTGFRAFNITYWVLLLILSIVIIWHAWRLYSTKRSASPTKSFKDTLGSSSSSSLNSQSQILRGTSSNLRFFSFLLQL